MVAEVKADLPTLIVIGSRAIVDEMMADLRARGVDDVRPLHGFLFAMLRGDGLGVGALAERLEVSHQAAGKIVSQMEGLGFVRRPGRPRRRDPRDGAGGGVARRVARRACPAS